MSIKELLDLANQGYPHGFLENYYDEAGRPVEATGDTLAEFIVRELAETYEPEKSDHDQLAAAYDVLAVAMADVSSVAVRIFTRLQRTGTADA